MATRHVINTGIWCAPDHNHTRFYAVGEQHVIGSALMPAGLSTRLAGLGAGAEDSVAVDPAHAAQRVLDAAKLLHKDGDHPLPW